MGGGGLLDQGKRCSYETPYCHTNAEFLRKVVTKNVEEGQKRAAASFDSKMEKRKCTGLKTECFKSVQEA